MGGRLQDYFGKKGEPSGTTPVKKGEPSSSKTGKKRKQEAWLPADERDQIAKAIRLSLGGEEEVKPASWTEAKPAGLPAVKLAVPSDVNLVASIDVKPALPPDVKSTAPPPAFPKPSSTPRVVPRPTFSDADFEPLSTATTMNRFDGSLDCLFWPRWMSATSRGSLRQWMLSELAWHRVCYTRPGGMRINTPRFTTTFGVDDTGAPATAYHVKPKLIPPVLLHLKERIEALVGAQYNALIINYYANGDDSISYHSDDEAFLGVNPNIASLSLGAARDFYLRRKAPEGVDVPAATSASGSKGSGPAASRPTEKMQLLDGSLLIMRGKTQAEWEHAIPKRKNLHEGRINITFRRAISPKAINNFINYNRGKGSTYRWRGGSMVEAKGGI